MSKSNKIKELWNDFQEVCEKAYKHSYILMAPVAFFNMFLGIALFIILLVGFFKDGRK